MNGLSIKIKDMRGVTLLELLVVVVILAIIAAIAVPFVWKVIENTKKDEQIANAIIMVDAVRLMSISEDDIMPSKNHMSFIPLGYMVRMGYIEDNERFEPYAGNIQLDLPTLNYPLGDGWNNEWNSYVVIANDNGKIRYYVRMTYDQPNRVIIPYTLVENLSRDIVTLYD